VRLSVSILKSSEIEAGYARGDFDVGVSMRLSGVQGVAKPDGTLLRRESLIWMAAPGVRWVRGEPLRLLALPDTCALHQFTVGLLTRRRVPHGVVHLASGVAGLQSALAAGLGIACLNEASLCPGVVRLAEPHGLPALPRAAFHLLPARAGETEFVGRARALLATTFA
jgi:DNA-binding transcriptional LysR family regulator